MNEYKTEKILAACFTEKYVNYIRSGSKSRDIKGHAHSLKVFSHSMNNPPNSSPVPGKEHTSLCFLRGNGEGFDCVSNREFSCTADFEGKRKRTED